jgi:hypothetical protein
VDVCKAGMLLLQLQLCFGMRMLTKRRHVVLKEIAEAKAAAPAPVQILIHGRHFLLHSLVSVSFNVPPLVIHYSAGSLYFPLINQFFYWLYASSGNTVIMLVYRTINTVFSRL